MKLNLIAIVGVLGTSLVANANTAEKFIEQCRSEMYASVTHSPGQQEPAWSEMNKTSGMPDTFNNRGDSSQNTALSESKRSVAEKSGHGNSSAQKVRSPIDWCSYRADDERALVDESHQYFGFMLKKGTLVENVEAIVDEFYPHNQGLITKVGSHKVLADMCILETNKNAVIQQIVEPYEVGKRSVEYGRFSNDIHVLFYENDPEFHRYFTGVGK